MSTVTRAINETSLKANLNELSHELVRELAVACKKTGIYGVGHPTARKALEKPFLLFSRIFYFKRFVNINLQRGQLYALNIQLKDTIFNGQIIQFMQVLDLSALLFEQTMTMDDFACFVQRFVTRVNPSDPEFPMGVYLKGKGITSIQANSELAFELFERQKQYRGDVGGDFSVRRFCLDQLSEDPVHLLKTRSSDADELLKHQVDFDQSVIEYVLPEKVASIPSDDVRRRLTGLAESVNNAADESEKARLLETLIAVMKLIDSHPDRERIVQHLDENIRKKLELPDEVGDPGSRTGKIKIESRNRIDSLLSDLFLAGEGSSKTGEVCDAFQRLLKTGQWQKADEVIGLLLERMGDTSPEFRQRALDVLTNIVSQSSFLVESGILKAIVDRTVSRLESGQETYEHSELIWQLFEKCRGERRFDLMATITTTMAGRRQLESDVTVYNSMAVKKAFENINQRYVIEGLVNDLIQSDYGTSQYIQDILIGIGSDQIALVLSENISHPIRRVRQQALRILAELGKASLRVFSQILMDDGWFERDDGRHELPDSKWYVLRNSIFVLGSLHDEEAIVALRLRMTDNDVRIRREIVAALEKIGSGDAVDLLVLMADDPVREIREKAIIAVGLIGSTDDAPLLIDVARRNPSEAIRVVAALGKLGGQEARSFLIGILLDDPSLVDLAAGKVPRDELRVAVIKALGNVGDTDSIDSIRQYKDRLSTAQKLLFKQSPVQRAITEILSRN